MKRIGSRLLCILLLLSLLLSLTACGKPETQLEKTAGYLQAQVAEPGATRNASLKKRPAPATRW